MFRPRFNFAALQRPRWLPTLGSTVAAAVGTAAAVAAATAVGVGIAHTAASSSGVGAASAAGVAISQAQGSSAGAATSAGAAVNIVSASGSSSGTATAVAASGAQAEGSAAGVGTASAAGAAVVGGGGVASAAAAATGEGRSVSLATGGAAGSATVVGTYSGASSAAGSAAGSATVTGQSFVPVAESPGEIALAVYLSNEIAISIGGAMPAPDGSYYVGERLRISAKCVKDKVPTNPTTLAFRYKKPSDAVAIVNQFGFSGEVVQESPGKFYMDVTLTEAGRWNVRVEGTGALVGADQRVIKVRAANV